MALRILLVDDNLADRHLLRALLSGEQALAGYALEFLEVADGKQALEVFNAEQPHLVISELMLPERNGLQLCHELRALPAGQDVPLLMVSGTARDPGAIKMLKESFAVEVLGKPVQGQPLVSHALQLLQGYRQAHPDIAETWSQSGAQPAEAQPAAPPVLQLDQPVRGSLREYSLCWLLVRAAYLAASGTLTVLRGRVRKIIYLSGGQPIFVDSNLRNESLGPFLVARRMLDEAQLAEAQREAQASGQRLGEVLVERKLFDESELRGALAAQIRVKLARVLLWADGNFSFAPGDDVSARVPSCAIEPVELVLTGLKKTLRTDALAATSEATLVQGLRLTPAGERFLVPIEQVFGAGLVAPALTGVPLGQLVEKGLEQSALLILAHVLSCAGLAELVAPRQLLASGTAGAQVPMARITMLRRAVGRTTTSPGLEELQGKHGVLPLQELAAGPLAAAPLAAGPLAAGPLVAAPVAPRAAELAEESELFVPSEKTPPPCLIAEDSGVFELSETGEGDREQLAQALAEQRELPVEEHDPFSAELYFQEGLALLKQRVLGEAVQALQGAVENDPVQPAYHIYLGWARFLEAGRGEAGAAAARPHLDQVFRLADDSVQGHEFAGWIARDAGREQEAVEHLTLALKLGPPRWDLFDAIKELLLRQERYEELERHYRRMILRLRDERTPKLALLWCDLVHIYQHDLHRPEDAALALEVARKLAPEEPRVQAATSATEMHAALDWHRVAEGWRQQLEAQPRDLRPLHQLYELHRSGGRLAQAFVAAALLVYKGAATEEQQRLYQRLAAAGLERVPEPWSPELLASLRHPEDLEMFERFFAELAPVLASCFAVRLEDLGSAEDRELKSDQLPDAFRATVENVVQQLGMPFPSLYAADLLGLEMAPLPTREGVLLVGASLLDCSDMQRIACATAMALSAASLGRRQITGRRGADFKVALLGTLRTCRPEVKVAAPVARVEQFQQALQRSALDRSRLEQLVDELLATHSKVNLSDWVHAVRCTATRFAALVCVNPLPVLQAVHEDDHVVQDLIGFALSEASVELWRRAEAAVAVA